VDELLAAQSLICLLALTGLEVVLGIDNVVFIAILVAKLPPYLQPKGRRVALTIAMVSRIILLCGIGFVMKLDDPLFSVFGHPVTGRDLILLIGGLFLIAKATYEIHDKMEGATGHGDFGRVASSFTSVMLQVIPLNIVFSLDSVITAMGMTEDFKTFWVALTIMIVAVIAATLVMMVFAGAIGDFVEKHPTMKMLALSFLVLIGVMLVAEGFGHDIPNGYIYFAMSFSLFVEFLNMRMRKKSEPVRLHQTYVDEPAVEV